LPSGKRLWTYQAAELLDNWPAVVEAYSGDEKVDVLPNGKAACYQAKYDFSVRQ